MPTRVRNLEKQRKYEAEWYQRNRPKRVAEVAARRREIRSFIDSQKRPCACGEAELTCLDFHHLDASQKEFSISAAAQMGYSLKRIASEIAKCVVLCSNCHRKTHAVVAQ